MTKLNKKSLTGSYRLYKDRFLAPVMTLAAVVASMTIGCTPVMPPGNGNNGNANGNTNTNTNTNNNTNGNGSGLVDPEVTSADHIIGSSDAPVTVVEYGDFECPGCKAFSTGVFPEIREAYVDSGEVRWVFRNYPLTAIHDFAQKAAEAAECAADQIDFFEFHDILYEESPELDIDQIKGYASDAGLDRNAFDDCLDGGDKAADVQEDLDTGTDLGVGGTPTFIINGQIIFGVPTFDQIAGVIDAAILAAEEDDSPFGSGEF